MNANGNLVGRGSDTFTYDQANRLKSANVAGALSSYVYDGDGKRASKTVRPLPLRKGGGRGEGSPGDEGFSLTFDPKRDSQ